MIMAKIQLLFSLFLFAFVGALAQSNELQKVHFLKGTWQVEGKQTYEHWKLDGDKLIGESYKIKADRKYVTEGLEIKIQDEQLIYTATVKNQNSGKGIPFTLTMVGDATYSFENAAHDFPKKIQYTIVSKTELLVKVLGENDQGFSFKMLRKN